MAPKAAPRSLVSPLHQKIPLLPCTKATSRLTATRARSLEPHTRLHRLLLQTAAHGPAGPECDGDFVNARSTNWRQGARCKVQGSGSLFATCQWRQTLDRRQWAELYLTVVSSEMAQARTIRLSPFSMLVVGSDRSTKLHLLNLGLRSRLEDTSYHRANTQDRLYIVIAYRAPMRLTADLPELCDGTCCWFAASIVTSVRALMPGSWKHYYITMHVEGTTERTIVLRCSNVAFRISSNLEKMCLTHVNSDNHSSFIISSKVFLAKRHLPRRRIRFHRVCECPTNIIRCQSLQDSYSLVKWAASWQVASRFGVLLSHTHSCHRLMAHEAVQTIPRGLVAIAWSCWGP